MVQALYIDPRGPYPTLLGAANCWDEERDARLYNGPGPIVSHPPCGPWGRLKHLYKGNEKDLGPLAVEQVRRWGGVLEHPAGSELWDHCLLPRPGWLPGIWGGMTIQVDQVEWGHACVKPTWIYVVGTNWLPRNPPFPGRKPTHGIWYGDFERSGHAGPTLLGASKEIRRRTPIPFAEWLISIAARCRGTPALQGPSNETAQRAG
jgi:hypothetical protein